MNKLSLGKFSKADLSAMKLPKGISITQVVLIVVIVVLAALTILFTTSYFGVVGERTDLNRDIKLRQQQINNIGPMQNIAALQNQLVTAQQDLISKNPFPASVDNIEVVYEILQAAANARVTCFQYDPIAKQTFTINGRTYSDNRFRISTSGAGATGEKITRIIQFLNNIEELPYNAIRITGLSLSSASEEGTWTVSFTLSILSQQ